MNAINLPIINIVYRTMIATPQQTMSTFKQHSKSLDRVLIIRLIIHHQINILNFFMEKDQFKVDKKEVEKMETIESITKELLKWEIEEPRFYAQFTLDFLNDIKQLDQNYVCPYPQCDNRSFENRQGRAGHLRKHRNIERERKQNQQSQLKSNNSKKLRK